MALREWAKCGYSASPSGNVQSSDVPAKAPRLKGKARKLAKKGLSDRFSPTDSYKMASGDDAAFETFENLANQFVALEVEEPGKFESEPEHATQPSAAPIFEVEILNNEDDLSAEKLLAIYCLFDSLQQLRKFVNQCWIEFALEKTTLIAASIMTNAAFQLAMRMQEETFEALPGTGDYQDVLSTLAVYNHKSGNEAPIGDGLIDFTFGRTHAILDKFCSVIVPGQFLLMKRGHFGIYRPRAHRSTMTANQQQIEDHIFMLELLP
ncbi:uncharacterized protein RSE6_03295 [Rhynchosporium secalis]|uniref:DUF6604 domain-containing protein n=1 Tax=Rhynchosporium secalis TaxID=38038 RepID=A0A1E1M3X3_RHYSE|nr:uncharacterized protein RSE6_03295 [Rhynchosporium secalis]